MKPSMVRSVSVVVLSGWLGMSVSGQAKDPNVATEKGKEGSAAGVAILSQATDLVRYARDNESPMAMLAAVQMLQRVRTQEAGDRLQKGESGQVEGAATGPEGKKGQTPPPSLDPKVLLAEAKTWAKGDKMLAALIDAELAKGSSAAGTLGSVIGPIRQPGRLNARSYFDWSVTMRGSELARVAVVGDGDTDLDLHVYDEFGNLIASDTDNTDTCYVEWTPKWTGKFRVRISNYGRVYNDYVLLSN